MNPHPPVAPWVERKWERRGSLIDDALMYAIVWVAMVETLLAAWGWVGRLLP